MTTQLPASETVVLLHGLARQPASMQKMAKALEAEGYRVVNFGYDSRHHDIEKLAIDLRPRIQTETQDAERIHFVTHSLGGIVVRHIQATDPLTNLARVVMLSPPNRGSEVVDCIGHWKLFKMINGPAGQQLGTASESFVNKLPPIDFECGVITGDRSINWINSCMIPGKDDGKVSIESTKTEELKAFKVVHATHPMIMKKQSVMKDVIHFLQVGRFTDES
ncbi:alpha/beta hydrolase [Coraliomargarita sinensis]|uniref:Alpha/beta hydrolase n=1 Tax=Coraliomargarita sinensis TaxID=2174842 RepID=A0A317ZJU2_9BACT|nr:alpha/beta fold hydrolase [Coraliomargarita sinensis]PXA05262.1 alpha/beta hydrolase [Coraliomargarita sinensis]